MTIDRNKYVTLPQWLLTIILSVATAGFIVWGTISINNVRITRNEKDIQLKADKDEVNRIYKILDEIKGDIKDLKNAKNK